MARKAIKKNDAVTTKDGWIMFAIGDQYLYRGKKVVDIRDGETTKLRVPVTELKPYQIEKVADETVTQSIVVDASVSSFKLADTELANPTPAPLGKYERRIYNSAGESIVIDVYDVLNAFKVTNPATAHSVKKQLVPGNRGYKDVFQDLEEAIQSTERAIHIEHNRQQD